MNDLDDISKFYAAAFNAMTDSGPHKLLARVANEASLHDQETLATVAALLSALETPDGANPLAAQIRFELARWDALGDPSWSDATEPKTAARRRRIYDRLEIPEVVASRFDQLFPMATAGGGVIITKEFSEWYEASLADRAAFYWAHYEKFLRDKGWDADAIANLGANTTRVVERLADPERPEAYQAKGLVVGYVQSGKTANFTGVVAKAIDAGYRLIIILTGQTDLLRTQTQRRLDKELVGKENLLRGVNPDDEESLATVDYWGEADWNSFVEHGLLPSDAGCADISRLTTRDGDYRKLQQKIEALDFVRSDATKPLNAPENLRKVPARVAVVKKNTSILGPLVKDLKRITAKLEDIPALIIDDESDQASVNTRNPAKSKPGAPKRTTINGHISDLLRLLPRAQYIGYTATPFANVFIDPSDTEDIFPASFILSLDRPPGYMGASDFHDLEFNSDPKTFESSNELAYVRDVDEDTEETTELRKAVDAFVLGGAIKLWRAAHDIDGSFRHHTMLVHESVKQAEHKALAETVRSLWDASGWFSSSSKNRLQQLYNDDFLKVMQARASAEEIPASFDDVWQYVGEVATRIAGSDNKPVWIVNGDKEVAELDLDFDARAVWKILVGGTKLSRGFTVEGLTVSYYRRLTKQADTLMQMGRWFGFRPGYRDLVRLYIGRRDGSSSSSYDVYLAFEAACRSEELFREEIKKYAKIVDGKPQVEPSEVPPLVAQHMPWLKPTAANKMYNAKLVERRSPGARLEPTGYSSLPKDRRRNAAAIAPIVTAAQAPAVLRSSATRTFDAYTGLVDHEALVEALKKLRWSPEDHFEPDLTWLAGLKPSQIQDWAIVLPQLAGSEATRSVFDRPLDVHVRARREGRTMFGGISDPKNRHAAATIAGIPPSFADTAAEGLHQPKRGAVLLYPVFERTAGGPEVPPADVGADDLIMALVIHAPMSTGSPDNTLVRFTTRVKSDAPIVDASAGA